MMHFCTLSTPPHNLSFAAQWKQYHGLCLGMARRWTNLTRALTPDDLAQVAMIKVWRASASYSDINEALVRSIAFNAFADICRSVRNGREPSYDDSIVPDEKEEDVSVEIPAFPNGDESRDSTLDLEPLLSILSPRQCLVIEKSYGLGAAQWEQSDESIACDLGITRQTVISDRKKAIREMQNRVGRRTARAMAL